LTIVWVLAVLALAWRCFGIGMAGWADQHSNSGANSTELQHQAAAAVMWLAFVAVGGALLIATVAFATRLPRTGAVYVVLAFVLGALVLPAAASADRTLTPSAPPSSAPAICQEHSGGDSECPGG
jgi:hypothetical protein